MSPIHRHSIDYQVDGAAYQGVLLHDPGLAGQPAVLMAPDWMGVSDGAIASAERIAGGGFAVFVADMYGAGSRPTNQDEAAAMAGPLKADAAEARRRIAGALQTLLQQVDARLLRRKPPAAVGFCFGGGNVLELCRAGATLSSVVSIHGDLSAATPTAPGSIKSPILVLHGSADPIAPESQRRDFEAEMTAAGAPWSMLVFGGAVHSFTDPAAAHAGVAMYDADCARRTFQMTEQFLDDGFAA